VSAREWPVENGTPEFETAAMEGLMNNVTLPWKDRIQCAQQAINGLHVWRDALADRAEKAEAELKWLLAEADYDTRAKFFDARRAEEVPDAP
jgi:hypothetical protein